MKIDDKYTDLIVIGINGIRGGSIDCICICGKQITVARCHLLSGKTKSCGCRRKANKGHIKKYTRKHPLYSVWWNMNQRCVYKKAPRYNRYGGRGIKVCYEWRNFQPFCLWAISNGWQKGLQIDRKDNDGNYTPDNCTFLTNRENKIKDLQADNPTGFIGVRARGKKFVAYIKVYGKVKWLGTYKRASFAAKVRDKYVVSNNLGYTLNFNKIGGDNGNKESK